METTRGQLPNSDSTSRLLAETVERACHLAATSDEVASVLVVPGRRPSYDELLFIRNSVAFMSLAMTVRADGSIVVRRAFEPNLLKTSVVPPAPFRLIVATERRALETFECLRSGLFSWNAGFSELAEGTR